MKTHSSLSPRFSPPNDSDHPRSELILDPGAVHRLPAVGTARVLSIQAGTVSVREDALTTVLHEGQSFRLAPRTPAALEGGGAGGRVQILESSEPPPVPPEILTVMD